MLTTNYSRFADRAVEQVNHELASGRSQDSVARQWHTVSTTIESHALQPRLGLPTSAAFRRRERLLIKLHGDVGHVDTMAIAGHDKESDSPLFVKPMLHDLYVTAGEAIEEGTLRSHRNDTFRHPIWWHVVGHGLRDRPLLNLLRKVIRRCGARDKILVINPDALRVLEHAHPALEQEAAWYFCAEKAAPYLARARRSGLPHCTTFSPESWGTHAGVEFSPWPTT